MDMKIDLYGPPDDVVDEMDKWLKEFDIEYKYNYYMYPGGGEITFGNAVPKRCKSAYFFLEDDEVALLFKLKFGEWV